MELTFGIKQHVSCKEFEGYLLVVLSHHHLAKITFNQRKSNLSQPTIMALEADEPPLPFQSASATVASAVAVPATAPATALAAAPAAVPTPAGMHTVVTWRDQDFTYVHTRYLWAASRYTRTGEQERPCFPGSSPIMLTGSLMAGGRTLPPMIKHGLGNKGVMSHSALSSNFEPVESLKKLPLASLFLAAYARDVWSRVDSLKASLSLVFGSILKIDATKKTCQKLAGNDANSANFVLNVGNERGEIVQCVVTSSKSLNSLQPMADGLMDRYAAASLEPPLLIYTDRDCCSASGLSKYQQLFNRWSSVEMRLDIWHFMGRLASGCCTKSHSLYGTFMSRISGCIFEWNGDNVDKLKPAKRGELVAAGLAEPSEEAVGRAVTFRELSRHCRWRTCGPEQMRHLVQELILSMTNMTDTLGVPLFNDNIAHIWAYEKKHIACLQDVLDLPLCCCRTKELLYNLGVNLEEGSAKRESIAVGFLEKMLEKAQEESQTTSPNGHHKTKKKEDDMKLLVQNLFSKRIFEFRSGRKNEQFKNFNRNILAKLDVSLLSSWLTDHLKQLSKKYPS
eukprot:gene8348-9249_t